MGCLENKFDHVCLVEMSCLHRLNISFFFFFLKEQTSVMAKCAQTLCTFIFSILAVSN